jgi:hypothetical protein
MGAPVSGLDAAEKPTAETLLSSFKTISAAERRKHATIFNYWLSIRGDRDFAPIHDLDPLELSDAASSSVLLELIGGGEEAEVRHVGDALKPSISVARITEAANPSLLACIGAKLSLIAISRNVMAFEDEYTTDEGTTRCWVTLLPFSSTGTWVDYVYGFVTTEAAAAAKAAPAETPSEPEAAEAIVEEPVVEDVAEVAAEPEPEAAVEPEAEPEPDPTPEPTAEIVAEVVAEAPLELSDEASENDATTTDSRYGQPGFSSKIFDAIAGAKGFFGTPHGVEPKLPKQPFEVDEPEAPAADAEPEQPALEDAPVEREPELAPEPEPEPTPVAEAPIEEPVVEPKPKPTAVEDQPKQRKSKTEGPLQTKLAEVRTKADEARMAKLRANAALYEGLSAAYDFALDAEASPEEYLKLVGEQGLKIQLRAPMAPVVRLAFDGLCDDATISQLETVLVWALKQDLPRGTLVERIEAEGGIGPILNGKTPQAKAA